MSRTDTESVCVGGGGHPLPLKRRSQSLAPSDGAPDDNS